MGNALQKTSVPNEAREEEKRTVSTQTDNFNKNDQWTQTECGIENHDSQSTIDSLCKNEPQKINTDPAYDDPHCQSLQS